MTVLPVPDLGSHTPANCEQATGNPPADCPERAQRADLAPTRERTGPADLSNLAADIERNGIDSIEPSLLAELARRGVATGLHPEVAAIIGDSSAPAVARERAFGLLHRLADGESETRNR